MLGLSIGLQSFFAGDTNIGVPSASLEFETLPDSTLRLVSTDGYITIGLEVDGDEAGEMNFSTFQLGDGPINLVAPSLEFEGPRTQPTAVLVRSGIWVQDETAEPTVSNIQWFLDGEPVSVINPERYPVRAEDRGRTISCTQTLQDAGGARSRSTGDVLIPEPVITLGGEPIGQNFFFA